MVHVIDFTLESFCGLHEVKRCLVVPYHQIRVVSDKSFFLFLHENIIML